MQSILTEIESLVTQINELQPITIENKKRLAKKFRLEFNYNSNHIEGNTLTYANTELLLFFDRTDGNHDLRELEEMKAHDLAYALIQDLAIDTERPLNETFIKNLNETILVRAFYKKAKTLDGTPTRRLITVGNYKQHPNSVRLQNGEMFEYASPAETPIKMGELMQWYIDAIANNEMHAIEIAAKLHYKFVCIHPFDDGNGRISRLLMNYVLIKNNLPPVIIKSADKKNYLAALNQADVGNINAFVDYIAKQALWSLQTTLKATKGESIEEMDDIQKEIALWTKAQLATVEKNNSRTDEIVSKCIENDLIPLVQKLSEKLLEFKTLFVLSNDTNSFDLGGVIQEEVGNSFTLLKEQLQHNHNVNVICWKMNFIGAKNSKTENITFELSIGLYEEYYRLTFNQKIILEKLHTSPLLLSEIDEYISSCMKFAFETIKLNTQNN